MKRIWVFVLLLSLGVNLGLGLALWRRPAAPLLPPPLEAGPRQAPPDGPDGPFDPDGAPDPEQVERMLRHRLDRLAARLDLSDEQREALWELHRDDGGQVIARRRQLQQARAAMQDLYAGGQPELAVVQEHQRRISQLQAALDSVVVEIVHRERAILTPEQRRDYRGLFSPQREGGRGRWERSGRPHGGPRGDRPQAPPEP